MSMILYNIRHRGSYEYEKFVLDTFQFSNEMKRLLKNVNDTSEKSFEAKIDKLDEFIGKLSDVDSVAYKILLRKLETKE